MPPSASASPVVLVVLLLLACLSCCSCGSVLILRGGSFASSSGGSDLGGNSDFGHNANSLEVTNAPPKLAGVYTQADDVNGRHHYERAVKGDARGSKIHLYYTGSQWVFHFDLDPSRNFDNLLAYSKVRVNDARHTSNSWHVRKGQTYETSALALSVPGSSARLQSSQQGQKQQGGELLGVPRALFPLYASFLLDAVATGLAMPLLPFYVLELGADALQLSMVISCNYVAQSVGCIAMGRMSDRHGRRPVLLCCLAASALSYLCVSRARTLPQVALARIIVGSFGGLTPVMQSCVADVSPQEERPKYLGRIMATLGAGFVLGPALSAAVPGLTTREKIRLSALLPLCGLALSAAFFKETRVLSASPSAPSSPSSSSQQQHQHRAAGGPIAVAPHPTVATVSSTVVLLVANGFLLMYAFATESIYAMFIKDSFGYGERVLSALFAFCGLFIGLFQTFLIKPLIGAVGKHSTLAVGNALLAMGMVGIALVRKEPEHFLLFAAHIVGYSIADTALVSLISRYSPAQSQGRDLALNQAAQSLARVVSPLVAGALYERSKRASVTKALPVGALPFLAAAVLPLVAVFIPTLLLLSSRARKAKLNKGGRQAF